jgi:hypothetical protein
MAPSLVFNAAAGKVAVIGDDLASLTTVVFRHERLRRLHLAYATTSPLITPMFLAAAAAVTTSSS